MERNNAKLTIENDGKFGFIYFQNGQVVHAEFEPDIGERAVYRLLALYSGNFKVESNIRPPAKTIQKNWNQLLLDGLHQLDRNDEAPEHRFDHLFERLFTVKGMQQVLIIDAEGQVVASSSEDNATKNFLFAFCLLEAEKIGEVFTREIPEFISIAASGQKYIMAPFNQFFVIMKMDNKTKLYVVLPLLKQALT